MPEALFYPWIDVGDDAWIKSALLYWDAVRTIVPESIETPYRSDVGRELQQAQFLVPLRVRSGMAEIEDLTEETLAYLGSREGANFLLSSGRSEAPFIHVDKLPHELGRIGRRIAGIHPVKLPSDIRDLLVQFAPNRSESEWLAVDDAFANFYMTLLATRLSERLGFSLLTALPCAESLAIAARFDAQVEGIIRLGMSDWRSPLEYSAFGSRRNVPRSLAPGLLAQLAIERIRVAPETSVEKLLVFRERHRDELAHFRAKIQELASSVEGAESVEALRQRVVDLHDQGVAPALRDLKKALQGQRIKFLGEGFVKIAFLSAGPTSLMVAAGMSIPTALLAGAGVSLVVAGTLYNVARRESLQANPFTYLLAMGRELA